MEVVLLEKIRKLGELGDKVNVAAGYGRNYLIPHKKAVLATGKNLADFESRRAELEKVQQDRFNEAVARKEKLEALEIKLEVRCSEEGKLFGSIGVREISEAMTGLGVVLKKSEIRLPEGPIRMTGEHAVSLQLHSDVALTVTVNVVSDA